MRKYLLAILFLFAVSVIAGSAAAQTISFSPSSISLTPSGTTNVNLVLDKVPSTGLSYVGATVTISNSSVAEITAISFPSWASLHSNTTLPAATVTFTEGDFLNEITAGQTNVTLATLTIKALKPGTANITVKIDSFLDDSFEEINTSISTSLATVTVAGISPPPVFISFIPSEVIVPSNSTTRLNLTYSMVSTIPPTSVGYINATVTVENASVAQITKITFPSWVNSYTNSSLPAANLTFTEVNYNSSVGQTNLTLATLIVKGLHQGITNVTITVNCVNDTSGIFHFAVTTPATITVVTGPPPIDGHTPKDLNHDGLYEDVNGDGHFNFGDVVFLFDHLSEIMSNPAYTKYLDFNHDGTVNFGDVVALFNMLSGISS